MYDVIIKNGTVYDGVSAEGRKADVAILNGKIAAVSELPGASAARVIDAAGLVVTPGFIDSHTHSDFNAFLKMDSPHKILQGVTTEVTGNCGMSAAPVFGFEEEEIYRVWKREGVNLPFKISWHELGEYSAGLEAKGLMTNLALLVGHGNLRFAVMGSKRTPADAAEIQAMKEMLGKAMEQGAIGLSLGLSYLPGVFADTNELAELAKEVKARNGVLAVHMQSEGKRLLESIDQVIEIAEKTGVRVEISHFKAAGPKNWHKIDDAFGLIESARERGLDIWADAYPYEAAFAELGVILPDLIYQAPDRLELIKDMAKHDDLKRFISAEWEKTGMDLGLVEVATVQLPENKKYEGRRISEIAKEKGQDPIDVFLDLLAAENFQVSAFSFTQSHEVVRRVIAKDYVSIGSDNVADFGPKPHPRVYGTFPRVLEEFVGKEKALSFGEAVRKMTSLPADTLKLQDKGRLVAGYDADVLIFDPAQVRSPATYEAPAQNAQGMRYVFVNGKAAVEEGNVTGTLAGIVVRKPLQKEG